MADGENVLGQRWPDIFFFFWDGVCFGAVDQARVSAAVGGRGWPGFLEYTEIHNCTGGHKTAELGLTRWVLSAHRGLASDPPKYTHSPFIKKPTHSLRSTAAAASPISAKSFTLRSCMSNF